MPTFQFKGRRLDTGQIIEGVRSAQNSQSLAAALRTEKLMPISISEKKTGKKLKAQKVPASDLAIFTKQFSVMLEAGLPLVQSLTILADQQHFQGI